jgi:oxygen-independent coproporphyrinogen-3 oxidase
VDPDAQATQFTLLMDWLAKAGYEHYEISNFALPGKRSRHNSSYWKGVKYLGLGPSAHSFDGHARQWNLSNNALYIKALQGGQVPFEKEELTGLQLLNEYIMTSLRTLEGCSLELVAARFGAARSQTLFKGSQIYLDRKQMDCQDGNLVLTKEGKLLADGIAAALFFEQ